MAIACAYCKGEHATPAQVRQCWQDGGEQDVPTSDDVAPAAIRADSLVVRTTVRSARRGAAGDGSVPRRAATRAGRRGLGTARCRCGRAGPDRLGRHLVIGPGGDIAEPWASADRLVIDATTLGEPEQALRRLRQAHHEPSRLVIELAVDFDRQPMLMTEAAPYELGPTFAFDREELHHLVWSNSVDGRDPARPTWIGLDTGSRARSGRVAPGIGRRCRAAGRDRGLDRRRVRFATSIRSAAFP